MIRQGQGGRWVQKAACAALLSCRPWRITKKSQKLQRDTMLYGLQALKFVRIELQSVAM